MHVTKALCGAKCWTDYRLIISKLNLCIQPLRRTQGKKTLRRLVISNDVKQVFIDSLDKQLEFMSLLNLDVETSWSRLRETVYNTSYKCLGPSAKNLKDWFDENCSQISQLLDQKQGAHKSLLDYPSFAAKKQALSLAHNTIQQKLRHMKDSLLSGKVDEIKIFVDNNDKNF